MSPHSQAAAATALQIARAIGRSKQAVARQLQAVPPAAQVEVSGKPAAAWRLADLPQRLWRALDSARARGRFRTVEDLLANPPALWKPAVPIGNLPPEVVTRAETLRGAMLPVLERLDSPLLSAQDIRRIGVESYARAFGQPIGERQWWRILKRTLDRDGGSESWDRLELYLDERDLKSAAGAGRPVRCDADLAEVAEVLGMISDPTAPTVEEKDAVWLAAVEAVQRATPAAARRLKKRLVQFLTQHAPAIGATENAIRVNLDRKLAKALSIPTNPALALRDGRSLRQGESRWPAEDVDRIVWQAVTVNGGRISEAVRELIQKGQLSQGTVERIRDASSDKSYLPASLRALVEKDVRGLAVHHQGPRAARLVVPHMDRDYSAMASMDQLQADDFTLPVYFYVADGAGWYRLTRGQCLVAIDVRSQRVLSWVLIPAEQYNALSIRTLFARTFEEHGIPQSLYLERGIWQRSRIVAGAKGAGGEIVSPVKTELGLKVLGISFTHALRPQAKTVEHVGALLQNRMHALPGYCGRNERVDCPEITQRMKLAVESRRMHPSEHFLSFEQWNSQLATIMRNYNAEEHDESSRIIPGLSPDGAFQKFWPSDPLKQPCKFGPEARHLLAHIQKPVQCGPRGIAFEIGGEAFRYFDAQTGSREGQQLIAWFNPDSPETCTFTNQRGRDAFTVERHVPVPASGGGEDLEREIGKARAHARAARARYNVLKATFAQPFRRPSVDLATAELGLTLGKAEARAVQTRRAEAGRINKIRDISERTGALVVGRDDRAASAASAWEKLVEESAVDAEEGQ